MKHQFAPDKIFAHKARIKEWLRRGLSRPVTFELDITNRCNNKCPACFGFHPGLDAAQMSWADIKKVLRQISAAGGKAVTFTGGGEPTVHPDIGRALAFARALGLDTALITNGLKLEGDLARAVLANCTWTRVSLDAATPEVYKKTHGLGAAAFARVTANTAALALLKKQTRSSCTIGVGFLTSPATAKDILPFARLCRDLGADYAQYRPLLRRHGEKALDYSSRRVLEDMAAAGRYATPSYKVLNSAHKYLLIKRGKLSRVYGECLGHNFAAVICADMKMYVCCHMRGVARYSIGDLKKRSLAAVWASRTRAAVCGAIDFKDCPPLCRCDSFNGILWDIKTGARPAARWPSGHNWEHENFI
ncbi:MAG: radical SAM protein [Elusimicrobiales bacterium]|nr:radical SAM protein [Elusimicrobiales bacterium]